MILVLDLALVLETTRSLVERVIALVLVLTLVLVLALAMVLALAIVLALALVLETGSKMYQKQ